MQHYKFNPKTLQMELVKIKRNYVNFIIAGAILMLLGFSSGVKVNTIVEKIPVILKPRQEECNSENVKEFITKLNLKFPKIVYQQAVCESANFQSPAFKQLNNLMGMENAKVRPTVGTNVGTRWAKYSNWKESLIDYALWQAYMVRDIDTEEDYYYFLDEIYCNHNLEENKGELYSTRLKKISWECQDPAVKAVTTDTMKLKQTSTKTRS